MPTSPNVVSSPKRKILVVDDNRPAAMSLTWAMETQGYDVMTCFDGPSAVSMADDFLPQVILLDIGMPVMDGLEVCRRIRADPLLHGTAVYAQTGWGDAEMRKQTREAGFDQHITKPINLDALLLLIESVERIPH
ncbi:response regulator [Asticcacaulis sp. 201]|uniref:response regulator n=1 Tax=Asticcacaulis sp. 201 TaxID=3028787 RepID=UPI002916B4B4|nr:response regulator [Asticcacaulis sp. 201]MDV6332955.1 response regulator [Asticcacaulis sp. 201]